MWPARWGTQTGQTAFKHLQEVVLKTPRATARKEFPKKHFHEHPKWPVGESWLYNTLEKESSDHWDSGGSRVPRCPIPSREVEMVWHSGAQIETM